MDHRLQTQYVRAKEYRQRLADNAEKVKAKLSDVKKVVQSEKEMTKLYSDLKIDNILSTYDEQIQGMYTKIVQSLASKAKFQYVEKTDKFLRVLYTANPATFKIQKPKIITPPQILELVYTMNTARYWVETRSFSDITTYTSISSGAIPAITPSILYILVIIHIIQNKLFRKKSDNKGQYIDRFTFRYSTDGDGETTIQDFTGLSVPIANSYEVTQIRSLRSVFGQYQRQIKRRKQLNQTSTKILQNLIEFISNVDVVDESKMIQDKFDTPILKDFKLFLDTSQQAENQLVKVSDQLSKAIPFSYEVDIRRFIKFDSLLENAHSTRNKLLIESLVDSLIKTIRSAPIVFNIEGAMQQFTSLPQISRNKFLNMLIKKNKQRVYTLVQLVRIKKNLGFLQGQFDEESALRLIKKDLTDSYKTMLDIYGNSGQELKLILSEANQLQRQDRHMKTVERKLDQYSSLMAQINNNFNGSRVALENTNLEIAKISQSFGRFSTTMSTQLRKIADEQSRLLANQTMSIVSNIEKEIASINSNSLTMVSFLESLMENMKQVRQQSQASVQNIIAIGNQMQQNQLELKNYFTRSVKQSQERQIAFIEKMEAQRVKMMNDVQNGQLDQRLSMNKEKIAILSDQTNQINELSIFANLGGNKLQGQVMRLQQLIGSLPTNQLTQYLQTVLQTMKQSYDAQLLAQIEHIGRTLNQNKNQINQISLEFQNFFSRSMNNLMNKLDTSNVAQRLQAFNNHMDSTLSKTFGSLAQTHRQMNNLYQKMSENRVKVITELEKEDANMITRIKNKRNAQIREIEGVGVSGEINAMKEKMKAALSQIEIPKQKIQDLTAKVDNLAQKMEAVVELVNVASKNSNPANIGSLFNEVMALAQDSELRPFDDEISRVYNNDQKMGVPKALMNFKQSLIRIEQKIDRIDRQSKLKQHQRSNNMEYRGNYREKRKLEEYKNTIREPYPDRSLGNIMRQNGSSFFQSEVSNSDLQLSIEHALALVLQFSIMAASLLNSRSDFGLQILNIIKENVKVPPHIIRQVHNMIFQDFTSIAEDLKQGITDLIKQHFPIDNKGQKYSQIAMNRHMQGWDMGLNEKSPALDDLLRRYSKK